VSYKVEHGASMWFEFVNAFSIPVEMLSPWLLNSQHIL